MSKEILAVLSYSNSVNDVDALQKTDAINPRPELVDIMTNSVYSYGALTVASHLADDKKFRDADLIVTEDYTFGKDLPGTYELGVDSVGQNIEQKAIGPGYSRSNNTFRQVLGLAEQVKLTNADNLYIVGWKFHQARTELIAGHLGLGIRYLVVEDYLHESINDHTDRKLINRAYGTVGTFDPIESKGIKIFESKAGMYAANTISRIIGPRIDDAIIIDGKLTVVHEPIRKFCLRNK